MHDIRRPGRSSGLRLEYTVVRLWEQPVEAILKSGLSTLPLAPLASVQPAAVPSIVSRVAERLDREAGTGEADELWVATYTLLGLRYPRGLADQLMRGARRMRESVTYQAILEEGREEGREEGLIEGQRRLLLLLGQQRFGEPQPRIRRSLAAMRDAGRIERMSGRLLDASSWDDLLATR